MTSDEKILVDVHGFDQQHRATLLARLYTTSSACAADRSHYPKSTPDQITEPYLADTHIPHISGSLGIFSKIAVDLRPGQPTIDVTAFDQANAATTEKVKPSKTAQEIVSEMREELGIPGADVIYGAKLTIAHTPSNQRAWK